MSSFFFYHLNLHTLLYKNSAHSKSFFKKILVGLSSIFFLIFPAEFFEIPKKTTELYIISSIKLLCLFPT